MASGGESILVVVAGTPARASLRMVVPQEVDIVVPGALLTGLRWDRILVQRGAAGVEPMELAAHLTIGGELHVLDTLPDIVADVLFPTGLVSNMEDTYRRMVARA